MNADKSMNFGCGLGVVSIIYSYVSVVPKEDVSSEAE